jgi:spermidine synthase
MIVSTALLGIGAGGTYLMLHTHRLRKPLLPLLVISPVLFSSTTLGSYIILNRIPFDLVRLEWDKGQFGYVMLAYGILAIPFFFSGLTVATALSRAASQAGKVYFSDLIGASTGAMLPLLLYPLIGPTGAVMAAAFLGLVAGIVLWWSLGLKRVSSVTAVLSGLSLLLLSGYLLAPSLYEMRLSPYKGLMVALRYPNAQHLSTRFNVLSRIDVVRSPAVRFAPGLSLTYTGQLPPQIGFTIDGDQLYAVTEDRDLENMTFLLYLPSAAPYSLRVPQKVLIMEPGGGLDVMTALYFNVPSIEVIERNPALLEVVRQPAPNFASRIYEDPRVKIHLAEPRSYLSARDDTYDIIILSPLHTLGASSAGLHGFSEEYRMTREAILQYYHHLSKDGWLMMTHYLQPVPIQEPRLAATLIETIENLGTADADQRLAVLRSWGTITLLLKHDVITPDEIKRLKAFSENLRFDLDYYPGIKPEEANRFNRFPQAIYYQLFDRLLDPDRRAVLYRDYPFNIEPVTDDRPFFGYVLKLGSLKEAYHLARKKWLFLINSGFLIPVMLLQAIFLAAVLIMVPTALVKKPVNILSKSKSNKYILLYYILIALSFMGVEIAMIQRLILFLGHPVFAVSVVLTGLLLFAGLGSLLTGTDRLKSLRVHRVLMILSVTIVAEGIGLPYILSNMMALPIAGRFVIGAILLAPLGILMGMPFPLGIAYLKNSNQENMIPWVWAANGSTSVVAAIFTVMLAMEVGFTGVFLSAALAYLLAGWTWSKVLPQKVG